MALLATSFIWVAALVVVALMALASIIFVSVYSHSRERSAFVNTVAVVSLTALLATACLLPVDIALVASTTDNRTGLKKDWATPDVVDKIVLSLKIVYYFLFSLDMILCWIVIPFTYFWYEEWDIDSTSYTRIRNSLRFTLVFVLITVILLAVGFFLPAAHQRPDEDWNLDYFKKLLMAGNGEKMLSFAIGILLVVGSMVYMIYTGAGMALYPIYLVKSIPAVSITSSQEARDALIINRERQRMIEAREVSGNTLTAKDKREMENLQREERMLTRRQRLADEGHNKWVVKVFAFFRPFKIFGGIFLLAVSMFVVASMLITCIDKVAHSPCGKGCGYVGGSPILFNPLNFIMVKLSKVFPIDYVVQILLVLFMFVCTVSGLSLIGIRILWMVIWRVRIKRTKPQALLMGTIMLMLTVIAITYSITMIAAPQYSHYGGQKYCNNQVGGAGSPYDCTYAPELIWDCNTRSSGDASNVCTPTIVTTFINRITLNFPGLGNFIFWCQFLFVGVFIITCVVGLVRSPKMDYDEDDEDEREAEEESLLAAAGTRIRGAWNDVRGRADDDIRNSRSANYGSSGAA